MSDPGDLQHLAGIPDPFPDVARSAGGALEPPPLPPSGTRSQVYAARILAVAAAVAYEAAWVGWVERRGDLGAMPSTRFVSGLAVPIAVAALALAAAAWCGRGALGHAKTSIAAVAFASPLAFAAATWLLAPAAPVDPSFWRHAGVCMLITALLTAPPLAALTWSFRHAFVTAAGWRTATLGVACGALAAATMTLVCSNDGAVHVILGHGTMMLLAAAVGARFGSVLCRA